jgi:hypothetical protein
MAGAFGTGLKNSVFGYLFNDLDLDVSDGLCVKHDDPDLWFAGEAEKEDGEKWTFNRKQRERVALEVDRATQALAICKNCPAKVNCLELGMRGTQIYYGIYGGTMPGERLLKLGRSMKKAEYANKLNFANKVRRTMKERGISG